MFLEFQKITTATPSKKSPIIINSDALLTINTDKIENKAQGGMMTVTRIEVIGYPKYTFYTATSFDAVAAIIGTVDVTHGLIPGSPCIGGNTVEQVYPTIRYPYLKASAIFNNTVTETDDYIFNPNFMLFAENTVFNDAATRSQQTGLMIVLRDTAPTKILTKLSYDVLFGILQPTQVQ